MVACLRGSLEVRDLAQEFDSDDEANASHSTDLLACRASSIVFAQVQAIDVGALAFIAEEAGAIVTDLHGAELASYRSSLARTLPMLVASARRDVHDTVLRRLQAER
jgi:fructose-1,6-bisphosphatase/inositol monophosphatase family enzyme